MEWKLDRARPICPQICEKIFVAIASGELAPNDRLMSVREVALAAGVNPNTVQKSFEELERYGAIFSLRGSGWYVSENTEAAKKQIGAIIDERILNFFEDMKHLGIPPETAKKYIEEWRE